MAYNLKHSGRAMLVGSATPGGAHNCEFHNIKSLNIRIKIPYQRAVSPFTDSNWQDIGVKPDIEVPSYKAFDVAYLEAVKTLLKKETDQTKIDQLNWILPILESNLNPVILGEQTLKSYAGVYGPATVIYDSGSLYAQVPNRRPMKLIAMSKTMFCCQWLDEFHLDFHPDTNGKVNALTAYLNDGRVVEVERTE